MCSREFVDLMTDVLGAKRRITRIRVIQSEGTFSSLSSEQISITNHFHEFSVYDMSFKNVRIIFDRCRVEIDSFALLPQHTTHSFPLLLFQNHFLICCPSFQNGMLPSSLIFREFLQTERLFIELVVLCDTV
jgi:hypothetical protein